MIAACRISETFTLAEFPAKTERQLVSIIDNVLEVGLPLAVNEPDVNPVDVVHRRAAAIYADAVMLVEKVEDVRERRRLEGRLRKLRKALDTGAGADGISVKCGASSV